MSKPVFEDLFKFSGRRNRQSYIYLQLASFVAVLLGVGIITTITVMAPTIGATLWFVGAIGLVALAVANWAAASQRDHGTDRCNGLIRWRGGKATAHSILANEERFISRESASESKSGKTSE